MSEKLPVLRHKTPERSLGYKRPLPQVYDYSNMRRDKMVIDDPKDRGVQSSIQDSYEKMYQNRLDNAYSRVALKNQANQMYALRLPDEERFDQAPQHANSSLYSLGKHRKLASNYNSPPKHKIPTYEQKLMEEKRRQAELEKGSYKSVLVLDRPSSDDSYNSIKQSYLSAIRGTG